MQARHSSAPRFWPSHLWVGLLLACLASLAAADGLCAPDGPAPTRVPFTTSRLHGSPEPAWPFRPQPAFPNLSFDEALEIVAEPGSSRLLVLERRGRIFTIDTRAEDAATARVFAALKTEVPELLSLFGLAFHPRYPNVPEVFVCHSIDDQHDEGTRVSRFRVDLRPQGPVLDGHSEERLLSFPSGSHNGGNLRFGPDGMLYISTGDARPPMPPDPLNTGQRIDDLPAAILRIDVNARERGRAYRIPADNPFVNTAGARPEIWAYGLRNPWKMAFDPNDGALWVGDVGWEAWEMVYRVERGGNYGWSIVEGPQPIKPEGARGPSPILPPVVAHPHTEAASITGGYVYRGRHLPALTRHYIYGDFETGLVFALPTHGPGADKPRVLVDTPHKIVTFGETQEGELIYADWGHEARLHRLAPNPDVGRQTPFPTRLSRTGLFADAHQQRPMPGVYPFEVNAPLWADGAHARRWVALPGRTSLRTRLRTRGDGRDDTRTSRPAGAVFVKTLSLPTRPASKPRPIETQVLHFDGQDWHGYTFRWNRAGTDAELVPAGGAEATLSVRDDTASGGKRTLRWRFGARAECLRCHNGPAGQLLGFAPAQLARTVRRAGRAIDQLDWLRALELVDDDFVRHGRRHALADPYHAGAPLEARARAWLHGNCAHCHRFQGGGSATIELNVERALRDTGLVDTRPVQGDFGLPDARIIAPGDPYRSVLYLRVAKAGQGHMPLVGAETSDDRALDLLHDFITSLGPQNPMAAAPLAEAVPALAARPEGGLRLQKAVLDGHLAPPARNRIIAAGLASHQPVVRDLFVRFDPARAAQSTLGPTPDFGAILSLSGDVDRGARLFSLQGKGQCALCHKVGDEGRAFGPDLTAVGAHRSRQQLLVSMLDPGREVDPAFAAITVSTRAGDSHTGFVVARTQDELRLKRVTGDIVTIPTKQIAAEDAETASLMPDGLLQHFTPQEAADLLAYLHALRP